MGEAITLPIRVAVIAEDLLVRVYAVHGRRERR